MHEDIRRLFTAIARRCLVRLRRTGLRAQGLLAIFAALAMAGAGTARAADADAARKAEAPLKPNVVVVMMDDLDVAVWNTALADGYLPNIQKHVIGRGTTFVDDFVSLSWCCPSRATYLTGQFPHNHGVIRGDGPQGGFKMFHDKSTLATWMHAAGYRTGLVGKYLNGYKDPKYVPPGWDTWRGLVAGGISTYCMYGYTMSMDGRYGKTFGQEESDYQTDVLAAMGVEFLKTKDPRPFFLSMMPVAPHYEDCENGSEDEGTSIRPPARYLSTPASTVPSLSLPSFNEADMGDKPKWMRQLPLKTPDDEVVGYSSKVAAIRAVDDMVGALAHTLLEIGHYDDTMIVVTSDNGFQYGTHRRDGKVNLYEDSIHLPLVIHAAGQAQARTTAEWVMNNDLAPTIAEAAGATPTLKVDGRSIMPLVEGRKDAVGRRTMLIELPPDGVATKNNPPYWMLRSKDPALSLDPSGRQILVYAQTLDPVQGVKTDVEFYDLDIDPYQISGLQGDRSTRRTKQMKAMHDRLDRMMICAGATCRSNEN